MSGDPSNAVIFAGEFRHGIDPKNRITIPSAWRSGREGGDEFFVRIDSTGSCLVVMPHAEFRKTLEKFESIPNASPRERQQAIRQFSAESLPCSADKQGRMVLPVDFCGRIGLQSDAILVGAFGRFEVWNPARWEATKAVEAATYQNLASQLGL